MALWAGVLLPFPYKILGRSPRADILGIFDLDQKQAEEAARLARKLKVGQARTYKSITDMVADPAIDAIWICSPNFTRTEVMEEITQAVIREKAN